MWILCEPRKIIIQSRVSRSDQEMVERAVEGHGGTRGVLRMPFPAAAGLRSWKDGVWQVKLRKAEVVKFLKIGRFVLSGLGWGLAKGWGAEPSEVRRNSLSSHEASETGGVLRIL